MFILNPCKPFYIDDEKKIIRMGNFKNTGKEIQYEEEIVKKMIEYLIHPMDKDELTKKLKETYKIEKEDIEEALHYLLDENIIITYEDYLKIKKEEKYNRQNLYFSLFTNHLEFVEEKYKNKKILVLGLGGIGSVSTYMLNRAGFENFTLVDFDTVEDSNLARQYPYQEEDIGLKKTDSLEAKIKTKEIHKKEIEIKEENDIIQEIRESDFVLCTLDKPSRVIRRLINHLCVQENKPVLFAGFSEHVAMVGPLVVPKVSACLLCNEKKIKETPLNNVTCVPSYGPICTYISSIVTNEIINYFVKYTDNNLAGKTMMFDISTYKTKIIHWKKNPKCKECMHER